MNEDEKRLRLLNDEIAQLLERHACGGAVFVVAKQAAAWRFTIPSWCGVVPMPGGAFRLKLPTKSDNESASSTLHFIYALRDMAYQCSRLFGHLAATAENALGPDAIDHKPFRGFTRDN